MNCQELKPKLYLLADGELTGSEEQAAKIHLAECADCQTLLASLEEENQILNEAARIPSWEVDRLRLLEEQLLQNMESSQASLWKGSLGIIAQASWLGILAVLFCLLMWVVGFNGEVFFQLLKIGTENTALKSLSPSLLFISGFMLLFVFFKYCQLRSLSKNAL